MFLYKILVSTLIVCYSHSSSSSWSPMVCHIIRLYQQCEEQWCQASEGEQEDEGNVGVI